MKYKDFIRFVIALAVFIGLFSFSFSRNKNRVIEKVKIDFINKNPIFLDEEMITSFLLKENYSSLKIQMDTLQLNELESKLKGNSFIENVNVYVSPEGILGIDIKERFPIVRVMQRPSFYLDSSGYKMDLSKKYTPRLPFYYGDINATNTMEIVSFFKKVNEDNFLKAEVIQLEYKVKDYFILMRSYPFEVRLGKLENLEGKFFKLKIFCQYIDQKKEKYLKINLKHKNQVIVTS